MNLKELYRQHTGFYDDPHTEWGRVYLCDECGAPQVAQRLDTHPWTWQCRNCLEGYSDPPDNMPLDQYREQYQRKPIREKFQESDIEWDIVLWIPIFFTSLAMILISLADLTVFLFGGNVLSLYHTAMLTISTYVVMLITVLIGEWLDRNH